METICPTVFGWDFLRLQISVTVDSFFFFFNTKHVDNVDSEGFTFSGSARPSPFLFHVFH